MRSAGETVIGHEELVQRRFHGINPPDCAGILRVLEEDGPHTILECDRCEKRYALGPRPGKFQHE